jgi:hypothetical protein
MGQKVFDVTDDVPYVKNDDEGGKTSIAAPPIWPANMALRNAGRSTTSPLA